MGLSALVQSKMTPAWLWYVSDDSRCAGRGNGEPLERQDGQEALNFVGGGIETRLERMAPGSVACSVCKMGARVGKANIDAFQRRSHSQRRDGVQQVCLDTHGLLCSLDAFLCDQFVRHQYIHLNSYHNFH